MKMTGIQIVCNTPLRGGDWDGEFIQIKSKLQTMSPLPAMACFDLLNPLDNSPSGFKITNKGSAKIEPWGVTFPNGSNAISTDCAKEGVEAVSFLVGFNLAGPARYTHIFGNKTAGVGFNFYNAGGRILMAYQYADGSTGNISAGDNIAPEFNKWYVACGVFDMKNKKASFRVGGAGLGFADIGESMPTDAVMNNPLFIGGNPGATTGSTMSGGVAFLSIYDGAFSATQRDAMIAVGREVLTDRGLENIS